MKKIIIASISAGMYIMASPLYADYPTTYGFCPGPTSSRTPATISSNCGSSSYNSYDTSSYYFNDYSSQNIAYNKPVETAPANDTYSYGQIAGVAGAFENTDTATPELPRTGGGGKAKMHKK